jgi:hypothetical protein
VALQPDSATYFQQKFKIAIKENGPRFYQQIIKNLETISAVQTTVKNA